nr:acetyl-CoA carboxylase beta subunit [Thonningia sanguinea]WJE89173.1 acetyl-CoA carboxylase beta subunit [Thonningia sanguinea]
MNKWYLNFLPIELKINKFIQNNNKYKNIFYIIYNDLIFTNFNINIFSFYELRFFLFFSKSTNINNNYLKYDIILNNITTSDNYFDTTYKYKHLWVQCENCYGLNYKKFFSSKMNICEHCNFHLKLNSFDRIELLITSGTWTPVDENLLPLESIQFYSEESDEDNYTHYIYSYQKKTGLIEAIQTGYGKLNEIFLAIGIMDFQFMGGSMGTIVGEKITRLIEHAIQKKIPLIIICSSGGARMQEGSLSLIQMAKISSALYKYQIINKLLFIPILASPTTGGVLASFGMLGDIIISEPNSYIAFAGKRVIEQTLNKIVPEGSQTSENLFLKGLFDLIVPRFLLKSVIIELLKFHL